MLNPASESILNPANLELLEDKYEQFLADPGSLPTNWIDFFNSMENVQSDLLDHDLETDLPEVTATTDLHMRMIGLMQSYRRHGHLQALTNPLHDAASPDHHLHFAEQQFSARELRQKVNLFFGGQKQSAPISVFIQRMQKAYCASVGSEFYYIRDDQRRRWLIEQIESRNPDARLETSIRLRIFEKLYEAESFEKFLATRYPGKKRFSLEGGESLIPTLNALIENAATFQIEQVVIGMAHRGRLNVLANVMGKDPASIFAEFDEKVQTEERAGDVKYHMGFSSDIEYLRGYPVHLSLGFNPSHLEAINPVILGSTRARQTNHADQDRTRHLPVLIHGDAALAGQGINYEILNMADLPGYTVGGTLHIVVNNQIGFTTNPAESRSSTYCTDLAKMLQCPIFHVNGDDPEACYQAILWCLSWRQEFKTDVFLDIICYRRWGHNETDEPAFTQPDLYRKIKQHKTTARLYESRLLNEGLAETDLAAIRNRCNQRLEDAYQRLQQENIEIQHDSLNRQWQGIRRASVVEPHTAIARERVQDLNQQLCTLPADFQPNSKIARLLESRKQATADFQSATLDWGQTEQIAYGSLLEEGFHIRLTGQDTQRGTFSHRHAVLADTRTPGRSWMPLAHIGQEKARIEIINSPLSEMAVLGFEFGYSLADPGTLTIWEAQFGDFVNNAQVIIDQFISSCEAKWHRMSGLVLLLPHGYEGQGPEHSSARLERFLQLCSRDNIQVAVPTTPAQYFHLIRRQMLRDVRKPLIIMSPKSLLRLPAAASRPIELVHGHFQALIDDPDSSKRAKDVQRILFCAGKIYYELMRQQSAREAWTVAIVRIEMLYPWPEKAVQEVLDHYGNANEVVWVQDEPRNQGAWIYAETRFMNQVHSPRTLHYIGRPASASTATGYMVVHKREENEIMEEAFCGRGDIESTIEIRKN
ncbi:MAG: 2-oxoglutarate dehydrogenase E1 component [Leptospiraceae bacterium]|nr:2-oxoglutarate dehydrogenase E1 component [Leptospiraceae bacterium]